MGYTTQQARAIMSTPRSRTAPTHPPPAAEREADLGGSEPRSSEALDGAAQPYVFDLDGGRPCLDFANTRGSSSTSADHLSRYVDLVAFVAQSDLITPHDAEWLRVQAEREPATATHVLARAKRLRDALRAIFSGLAAGEQLAKTELGVLNADLAASLAHARIVPAAAGEGYAWGWSARSLETPLWPITRSAADLLTSDDERALVRECGADDCAWLFIDNTRNRSRQWCSMQSCGNREKARRHYQRVRDRRAAKGCQ
ncbi:MAG: ABATE domain-containing protein [Chloroflexi bacterium]|nr:ABATE domain-containing protein [Chloroflexota bacterium]